MKAGFAVARGGLSGQLGQGWGNRGGDHSRSRIPCPLCRDNDVAVELADANDLQSADYRILASGRHPDPRADSLQGRPRQESGKVELEKGSDPGADEGRRARGGSGVSSWHI